MGLPPDQMALEQLTSGTVAFAGAHHSQKEYLGQPNTLASGQLV